MVRGSASRSRLEVALPRRRYVLRRPDALVRLLLAATFVLGGCANAPSAHPPDLGAQIEHAHSRADHEAIAVAYTDLANANRLTAARYEAFAKRYEDAPSYRSFEISMAQHHANLARQYRQTAAEADALAGWHRQLGKQAPQ